MAAQSLRQFEDDQLPVLFDLAATIDASFQPVSATEIVKPQAVWTGLARSSPTSPKTSKLFVTLRMAVDWLPQICFELRYTRGEQKDCSGSKSGRKSGKRIKCVAYFGSLADRYIKKITTLDNVIADQE